MNLWLQLERFSVILAAIIIDLYVARLVSMTFKKLGEKYDLEKELESVQLRHEEIRLLLETEKI
jgi:hypothetical protein